MSVYPGSFANKAQRDLSFLGPALLNPLRDLRNFSLQKHRALIALAAIGLVPLGIYVAVMSRAISMGGAYWGLALYFSLFWLVCFLVFFRGDSTIKPREVAICYFGTSLVMILTLIPISVLEAFVPGPSIFLPLRAILWSLLVGFPEEACKSVALFALWKLGTKTTPRTMLIYGLICGLGFGFREGIGYQLGPNVAASGGDLGLYYLLNLLRLTSLPFLHAIWTGIAGYFIGFAAMYPKRKVGFIIVALGLPSILHGVYDSLFGGFTALAIAALAVILIGLYFNSTEDLCATLENDHLRAAGQQRHTSTRAPGLS